MAVAVAMVVAGCCSGCGYVAMAVAVAGAVAGCGCCLLAVAGWLWLAGWLLGECQ